MSNDAMHQTNTGNTGQANRWWQQVLAFGCLPDKPAVSEARPAPSAASAFVVMP